MKRGVVEMDLGSVEMDLGGVEMDSGCFFYHIGTLGT